jgi:hypothetical protein
MQVAVGQSGQVFHAENVVRVQLDNLLLGDARPFLEGITGVRRLAAQTLSSHSGRVLQPIPSRSPHQTPKFCVHFLLVPPRRVPADGATLIKLYQVAAMKNLRAQSVHLAAALS